MEWLRKKWTEFNFSESIDTYINVLEIIGVNTKKSFKILACPSNPKVFMKVIYYEKSKKLTIMFMIHF